MAALLKRYFFSGLMVLIPIWVTFLFIRFFVEIFDSSLSLLPDNIQPDRLLGFHIPGLGIIVSLIIIMLMGTLASNILGSRLVAAWEKLMGRIPLVRTVYSAVKQVSETLLSKKTQSFRKVYLMEYPRKGVWCFAFQSGETNATLNKALNITEPLLIVYVTTTPNPTSGFMLLVQKSELIELDMSVDEALKTVISLGVIQGNGKQNDPSVLATVKS
jgi:uncharacterized membrane protein